MTKPQEELCNTIKNALIYGIVSISNDRILELTKTHDGCDGCAHIDDGFDEEPCKWCRYNYEDKWEAKK